MAEGSASFKLPKSRSRGEEIARRKSRKGAKQLCRCLPFVFLALFIANSFRSFSFPASMPHPPPVHERQREQCPHQSRRFALAALVEVIDAAGWSIVAAAAAGGEGRGEGAIEEVGSGVERHPASMHRGSQSMLPRESFHAAVAPSIQRRRRRRFVSVRFLHGGEELLRLPVLLGTRAVGVETGAEGCETRIGRR